MHSWPVASLFVPIVHHHPLSLIPCCCCLQLSQDFMVQFPLIQSTIEMLLNVMLLCAVVGTDVFICISMYHNLIPCNRFLVWGQEMRADGVCQSWGVWNSLVSQEFVSMHSPHVVITLCSNDWIVVYHWVCVGRVHSYRSESVDLYKLNEKWFNDCFFIVIHYIGMIVLHMWGVGGGGDEMRKQFFKCIPIKLKVKTLSITSSSHCQ